MRYAVDFFLFFGYNSVNEINSGCVMAVFYGFSDYVERLENAGLVREYGGEPGTDIKILCADSKKAGDGAMFVCKGNHFKPEYLADAEARGAVCYVSEKKYDTKLPYIIVSDVRAALAELSDMYYGSPWKKLRVTAVTGTKGKTTVIYYTKALIDAYSKKHGGRPCGLISGIETFDGKELTESVNTTPESIDLQRIFSDMAENGLHSAVCEVSSQALKYSRVRCTTFDTAVFTNIGEDHISPVEHPDFEDYFSSKLRIFSHCKRAVINRESAYFPRILAAASVCEKIVTFGNTPDCTVYYHDVRKENGKTCFTLETPDFKGDFSLAIAGFFNASNAAAAVAATLPYGIDEETVREVLSETKVSGRMETYSSPDGRITAIVDYAHNEMSYEQVFSYALKEYPGRRVVSVFGATGNKAENRRYTLGKIAGKYSDLVIITSEHPDYESPYAIAEQIAEGVKDGGKAGCAFIEDRELAIITAVKTAEPDTLLLVLGEGNETTQRIKGVLHTRRSDSRLVLDGFKERYEVKERIKA